MQFCTHSEPPTVYFFRVLLPRGRKCWNIFPPTVTVPCDMLLLMCGGWNVVCGAALCGSLWIWWKVQTELVYEYVFLFIQALPLPNQLWLPAAQIWAVTEPVLFYFLLSS